MSLKDIGKKMVAIKPTPPVKVWPAERLTEVGLLFRVHYRHRDHPHELDGCYGVTVAHALIVRECRTTLEAPSRRIQLLGRGTCLMSDHDLVPVSQDEFMVAEVMLS
jgi:hypothetical protein